METENSPETRVPVYQTAWRSVIRSVALLSTLETPGHVIIVNVECNVSLNHDTYPKILCELLF